MRCLCVLLLLCPAPLWAGGWLRDQGTGFFSTQFEFHDTRDPMRTPSVYLDYGLRANLTVGLSAWQSETRTTTQIDIFARTKLPLTFGGWALSAEGRVGGQQDATDLVTPMVGIVLGAGHPLPNGWLDSSFSFSTPWSDPEAWRAKGEISLGHTLSDRWTIMGQFRHEATADLSVNTATGWVIYEVRPGMRLAAGAERSLSGGTAERALFSVWSDF